MNVKTVRINLFIRSKSTIELPDLPEFNYSSNPLYYVSNLNKF